MRYSDKDMMVLTQIAYYDFNMNVVRGNNYQATIRELLQQSPGIRKKLEAELDNASSEVKRYSARQALELYDEIIKEGSPYGDWVLKAVKDDNVNSGFYGCLVETPEGDGLVGFRGSESHNTTQKYNDWIMADAALIDGNDTLQQQVAEEFMQEINQRYDYDNYYLSGHSLGGNLSIHAALTAPDSMKSKIRQSYSFDGPGFSVQYLAAHRDEIEAISGKLTHYQWSLVGTLLFQPEGVNDRTIGIQDDAEVGLFSVWRHSTGFVRFDKDGNVSQGNKDLLAILGDIPVKWLDVLTNSSEAVFVYIANEISKASDWIGDTVEKAGEIVQNIKAKIRSLFDRDTTAMESGRSREAGYAIQINGAREAIEELGSYIAAMDRMSEQLEQIVRKLPLSVKSAGLWNILNHIKIEQRALQNNKIHLTLFQNRGREILNLYYSTEQIARESYHQ